jgi:ComEC/Rec2-related protein
MADFFSGPNLQNSSAGSRGPFWLQTENSSLKDPAGIPSSEILGFRPKSPRDIQMPILEIGSGDITCAIATGLLIGMLAAGFAWNIMAISLCAVLIFPALKYFFAKSRKTSAVFALIVFLAILAGAYYFHFFVNWQATGRRLPDGKNSFDAVVVSEPAASEKHLSFFAELQPPFAGNVEMFAPPESEIRYGDLVEISGTFVVGDSNSASTIFPKKIFVVSEGHGSWLIAKLGDFKRSVLQIFSRALPQDDAALLGGMTLGGTAGMSAALKNDMTASETLYVTSMYGWKIAMIVMVIEALLAGFLTRRIRFCVSAFLIVLFVLMSGGNVSAVRGGIMAYLLMFAKETGSVFSRRNALLFAAAGMALFDPTIVAQAAFLLSFLSVAGMAFLSEPIRRFLHLGEGNGMFRWKDSIIVSMASLVPIVPLVSAIFGLFSLTAVFANILIAPTIPIGMGAGAALAIAGCVSQCAAFFVGRGVEIFLSYALWIIHFFAAHVVPLPFSFSGVLPFAIYYAAVGFFAYAYREEKVCHSEVPPQRDEKSILNYIVEDES